MAKTVSGNYLLENTKAGVSKEKIKRIRAAYTKNVSEDQIEGQSPGKTTPTAGRSTVTRTTMLFNTELNHQRGV